MRFRSHPHLTVLALTLALGVAGAPAYGIGGPLPPQQPGQQQLPPQQPLPQQQPVQQQPTPKQPLPQQQAPIQKAPVQQTPPHIPGPASGATGPLPNGVQPLPGQRAPINPAGTPAPADGGAPFWRSPTMLMLLALVAAGIVFAAWSRGREEMERAADQLGDERARAEALARRNEKLVSIVDATRRVTTGSDVDAIAKTVARETRDVMDATGSAVFILDRSGTLARPIANAGSDNPIQVAVGDGIVGQAIDTHSMARGVVKADAAFPGVSGDLAITAAPLLHANRVIGALVVTNAMGRDFDRDSREMLTKISAAAASALVTAQKHAQEARAANTDALTGLANRRRLDGDLAQLGGAPATGVGFLMVDVDHFKAFNDTHGHPAGDAVLREVGRVIASAVRQGDVVYRFGGEEFAALLPGASVDDAKAVGERIRAALHAAKLERGAAAPGGYVTASIGVTRASNGEVGATLIEAADQALYEAKRSGRDRVAVGAIQ